MYSLLMRARNWCFDHGWLEQRRTQIPVISVGNLSIGGTGKTPMVEWLIHQCLSRGIRPAVMSRGYGRCTHGPVLAQAAIQTHEQPQYHTGCSAAEIGDEPWQIFQHFGGQVPVIVSGDRRKGLPLVPPESQLLILDDAYQHRYLQRDCNILLTDYSHLYSRDKVLPWGRLREPRIGAQRAHIIIVTKCPRNLSSSQAEAIRQELRLLPHQRLFFSTISYETLPTELSNSPIQLLTGIANPQPLLEYLEGEGFCIQKHYRYPDHHRLSSHELASLAATQGYILTTSKDYARLEFLPKAATLLPRLVPIHIETQILFNQTENLFNTILDLC